MDGAALIFHDRRDDRLARYFSARRSRRRDIPIAFGRRLASARGPPKALLDARGFRSGHVVILEGRPCADQLSACVRTNALRSEGIDCHRTVSPEPPATGPKLKARSASLERLEQAGAIGRLDLGPIEAEQLQQGREDLEVTGAVAIDQSGFERTSAEARDRRSRPAAGPAPSNSWGSVELQCVSTLPRSNRLRPWSEV